MIQNATEKAELTPSQEIVITKLVAGTSITDIAKSTKISRASIHRWKNDVNFVAALNRARKELREVAQLRLSRMVEAALDCIESHVGNDPRIALSVLRGVGLLDGVPDEIGSGDANELEAQRTQESYEKMSRNPFV